MFYKDNVTDSEIKSFYNKSSGVYESIIDILKDKNDTLVQYEEMYETTYSDIAKGHIRDLKERIKELEIQKGLLEYIYSLTFNE